jgi:hypothetical protein
MALDRAVGRLGEAASREVPVITYPSYGIGPGYSGTRLLDHILTLFQNRAPSAQNGLLMGSARVLWRRMLDSLRRPLKPWRNSVSDNGFKPGRRSRSYFEVFADDRSGGIRLNLSGREAHGIVAPRRPRRGLHGTGSRFQRGGEHRNGGAFGHLDLESPGSLLGTVYRLSSGRSRDQKPLAPQRCGASTQNRYR